MARLRQLVRNAWRSIDTYGNLQTLWELLGPIGRSLLLGLALMIVSLATDTLARVTSLPIWLAVPFWLGAFLTVLAIVLWFRQKILALAQPAPLGTPLYRPPLRDLGQQCVHLSHDILQFLHERRSGEDMLLFQETIPKTEAAKRRAWVRRTNEHMKYSDQTSVLYHQRFAGKVGLLIEILDEYGLADAELKRDYESGLAGMAARDVAKKLGIIGERLLMSP